MPSSTLPSMSSSGLARGIQCRSIASLSCLSDKHFHAIVIGPGTVLAMAVGQVFILWVDCCHKPQAERSTWSGPNFPDAMFDFILVFEGLRGRIDGVWVDGNESRRVSDHQPLVVKFRVM